MGILRFLRVVNREGDVRYWKGQAQKWQQKYEASEKDKAQMAAQLEKTEASLRKYMQMAGVLDE